MPHHIYILQCCDDSYYVGYATDPSARLEYHQSGRGGRYTSKRLPVRLVFQELQPGLAAAVARERQIKGWPRAKKAALVAADVAALKANARRRKPSSGVS